MSVIAGGALEQDATREGPAGFQRPLDAAARAMVVSSHPRRPTERESDEVRIHAGSGNVFVMDAFSRGARGDTLAADDGVDIADTVSSLPPAVLALSASRVGNHWRRRFRGHLLQGAY